MKSKVTQVIDKMHLIALYIIDLDDYHCLCCYGIEYWNNNVNIIHGLFHSINNRWNQQFMQGHENIQTHILKGNIDVASSFIVVFSLTSLWNRNNIDILCQEMVTLWYPCIKPYNEDESWTWEMKSNTCKHTILTIFFCFYFAWSTLWKTSIDLEE